MMETGVDFAYFDTAPVHFLFAAELSADISQHVSDYQAHSDNAELFDPAFAAFQQRFRYDPTQFVVQPITRAPPKSHPPRTTPSSKKRPSNARFESSPYLTSPIEDVDEPAADIDHSLTARSSSEEKDSRTPQQNKRKAQNRAAQRAFRERKERHVKELEARNSTLQHAAVVLQKENEKLKRELVRVNKENQVLKARICPISDNITSFLLDADDPVTDLFSRSLDRDGGGQLSMEGQLITPPADGPGEPLLDAGATWDYIQAHELVEKGLADIGDTCEKLRRAARCDGTGRHFQEKDVTAAIRGRASAGIGTEG